MTNQNIYLHELVDIVGQNRAKYMAHMLSYAPTAREEKAMLNVGVWATVGSTERWPQVVNIWELPGWRGVARNFIHELSSPTKQDPSLAAWWAEAAGYRSGGYDRLMIPAPYCPAVQDLVDTGVRGTVHYHETIQIAPGRAKTFLAMMEQDWMPVAARLGMRLIGAYRTAMVNDSEAILLWSFEGYDAWADFEIANEEDAEVARWRTKTRGLVLEWRNKLLSPAPSAPLVIGKVL